MAFKVEKFFCLSLPKAAFTIGFLTIFLGMLQVFTSVVSLIHLKHRECEDSEMYDYREMEITEWGVYAHILVILSGVLLIIGTIKKSHLLLLPWLGMIVPSLINSTFFTIIYLVRSTARWIIVGGSIRFALLSGVGYLFLAVFQTYMWIVVYTFSCKMREEKNQEKRVQYDSQPESANTADDECNPKNAFQRI